MKVLLIDDDPLMAVMVQAVIDEPGDVVTTVDEGKRAVAAATSAKPDVILLDMNLPDSTGDEILAWLKSDATASAIPVVICSASADTEQLTILLSKGATSALPKPFDPITLRQRLAAIAGVR